jgi:uncharacterized protein (TIGR02246 family)
MRFGRPGLLAGVALLALASGCAPKSEPQAAALAAELTSLRAAVADARAQNDIRGLMHAYGRLIDARDWDGFAKLWTDDAVYVGGPGSDTLRGGAAIAGFLRDIIASNPSGVGEPNFHVFFNEEISVAGSQARATSMSTFVTPNASGAPVMSILARYEDEYVLVDGHWRFKGRIVRGNLPAPRPTPRG